MFRTNKQTYKQTEAHILLMPTDSVGMDNKNLFTSHIQKDRQTDRHIGAAPGGEGAAYRPPAVTRGNSCKSGDFLRRDRIATDSL